MKTIVVGYTPDEGGQEALALAGLLGSAPGARVLVTVVVPQTWGYPAHGIDTEYGRFLDEHAAKALDESRRALASLQQVEALRSVASSPTEGLLHVAKEQGADCIAIGSARGGAVGRLFLGGVSEEILHACTVPVVMAPRDYQVAPGTVPKRLTVAFAGAAGSERTVLEALRHARAWGATLRLASFVVRDRTMFPSLSVDREDDVIALWKGQAAEALERVRAQLAAAGTQVETAVAAGPDWELALADLDWQPGELLVLGSSRLSLLERVFLGSNGRRILRASPVPVMVLPRPG